MLVYWIMGHRFAEGHDRAVRYIDMKAANNRIKDASFPKEGAKVEWCNKCSVFHITKLSSMPVDIMKNLDIVNSLNKI